jgi:hypothetical protein
MTRTELFRLVRKLYRHRKLTGELPDLEDKLAAYLEVKNLSKLVIFEYQAEKTETELVITQAPRIDKNQLSLTPDYRCPEEERRRT